MTKKLLFKICIVLIIFLAMTLRFYGYEHRWGLAYDQAHDALVARSALSQHKIPMVGPFSSAGPFQTGPEWYWLIMLGTFLYSPSVISPWVLLTVLFVVSIYFIIKTGELMGGKRLGIAAGLIAAISPANIAQSVNMSNQAPLAILSVFSVWAAAKYFYSKKNLYLFILGIFIGLGVNMHLQGALLIPFFFLVIIFKRPNVKDWLLAFLGLVIPFIPLIIFDATHHFINIRHMLTYYFHDQYNISLDVLGRRWTTYLKVFWIKSWSYIIGGNTIIGITTITTSFAVFIYLILKKCLPKIMIPIIISFIIAVIAIRYTRTPIFDSYLMFLHATVFLIVAFAVITVFNKNKIIGIIFLSIIVFGSLQKDVEEIKNGTNNTAGTMKTWTNLLTNKYPGQTFAIYDYKYNTVSLSAPLSLYLSALSKSQDNGRKIGVILIRLENKAQFQHPALWGEKYSYQLYDLSSSSSGELSKEEWVPVTSNSVYHATEEWSDDVKLRSKLE